MLISIPVIGDWVEVISLRAVWTSSRYLPGEREGELERNKEKECMCKREIERDRQIMYNIYFINITF